MEYMATVNEKGLIDLAFAETEKEGDAPVEIGRAHV